MAETSSMSSPSILVIIAAISNRAVPGPRGTTSTFSKISAMSDNMLLVDGHGTNSTIIHQSLVCVTNQPLCNKSRKVAERRSSEIKWMAEVPKIPKKVLQRETIFDALHHRVWCQRICGSSNKKDRHYHMSISVAIGHFGLCWVVASRIDFFLSLILSILAIKNMPPPWSEMLTTNR